MLTNSGFGASSDILSVLVSKRWDWGLDASLGYASTDGKDVSPMTSSVAFSNFSNLALTDLNNPRPGKSNYVVPHRFSLRASLGRQFIEGHETRFTIYGYLQEGQPGSFVMDSDELEGGRRGRHLLYIPDGQSDPNVVFGAGFQTADFFAWVNRQGFGPGFVPRNSTHANWSNRLDFGVHQDFAVGFDKVSGRAFVRIYNFANFLNNDWGKVTDANFFSNEIVDIDVNSAGQYVFKNFSDRSVSNLLEFRSLWEARWGIEFRF